MRSDAEDRSRTVYALARALETLGPGDRAELRRMGPGQTFVPAFFKLVASFLEDSLPLGGEARDQAEIRWGVVLSALAQAEGLLVPGKRLGASLAEADVSEMRLLKLLRAHDEGLWDGLRGAVHQLSSRAVPVDPADIADLVLTDGRRDEDRTRRRIARDFYRTTRVVETR